MSTLLLALKNCFNNFFYYPSLKIRPSYDVLELAPRIINSPFFKEDNIDCGLFAVMLSIIIDLIPIN